MSEPAAAKLSCGRAVTTEERDEVYRFRYAVYVEEMHKPLASADHSRRIVTDELDEYSTILYVRAGDDIVATIRSLNAGDCLPESYRQWFEMDRFASIPLGEIAFGSRFMVAAPYRRSGVSGLLLRYVYELGRESGVWLSLLHCAPSLVALYEALGYRRISSRIVETDVGQHLTMANVADDIAHLTAMRSLFLPLASRYPSDPGHAAWFARNFSEHLHPSSSRAVGLDAFASQLGRRLASETGAFFDGVPLEVIRTALKQAAILPAREGDLIVRRGETGSEIFVVLSGAVEIRSSVNGARKVLRTLGKGDVFGELAILGSGRRTADVVALQDVELLVLTPDFLERLTKELPSLASKLLLNLSRILAGRLISNEEIADADQ